MELNDAVETIEKALETPDEFREFLEGLPRGKRFDPEDPCGCFLHEFFEKKYDLKIVASFNQINPEDPRKQGVSIEDTWTDTVQRRLCAKVWADDGMERIQKTLTVGTALKVLEEVTG